MIRKIVQSAIVSGIISLPLSAQTIQKADTVIVNLATTSRITFTLQDRKDIEILKHFDFQNLFNDILTKMKNNDTTSFTMSDTIRQPPATQEESWSLKKTEENEDDDDDNDDDDGNDTTDVHSHSYKRKWKRNWQLFNVDIGTNNYLTNGKFPDNSNALNSVRPWGSWYIGLNSTHRAKLANKFFLEWGLGVSWYNFKFEKDNILVQKNDVGVLFLEDTVHSNFVKSKLTATYLHASFIPVIDFGKHNGKSYQWNKNDRGSFRIGLGPYIGYRIGSYSKLVYEAGRHNETEKNKDSFYLANLRYGLRLQVGYHSTDLFFNYDLNNLFLPGKGPSLNAFSFGVIL